ncbi:MAG: tetratricopeptide repeat protein [Dermatophilaceae bacterium]
MKFSKRSTTGPDKGTLFLRLGALVLVVGVVAFSAIYYQDQHVEAGPSLTGRQIQGAEAAVKKAPNNVQVRLQLAAAYLQDKRPDDALTQYDEILKGDKANRSALMGRGGVLTTQGDLTAASVAYHKITDVAAKGEFAGADPVAQAAHYYLGSIAVKQGKATLALTELQKALKIDPTDSDALYLVGVAELKNGAPKLAVLALKKALLFVPTGWCEPYTQLNVAYTKLGNAPEATYAGAMANFCNKKPVDAKRQLNTLTSGPVKIEALLGLGLIAQMESNNPEAISWYQKVLKVDPTNASAATALSQLGVTPTKTAKK